MLSHPDLISFKTIFISILLEAFPFLLLGVLVSSLLQAAVSEQTLQKWIPKHPVAGLFAAATLGVVFPVCECGMIPVVRRLIQKGMPLSMGVAYLLAAPIVNPVVFFSTHTAFRGDAGILYSRMGLAYLVALAAGGFVHLFVQGNPLRNRMDHFAGPSPESRPAFSWSSWTEHMLGEFFSMGKYLLFGVLAAAALQSFVPRAALLELGGHSVWSYPFLMGLAYVLSLCSTADAFVAASFTGAFPKGALVAFLVFGPMLDLKSTLMLFSAFRPRFVAVLILLVTILVWAGAWTLSALF